MEEMVFNIDKNEFPIEPGDPKWNDMPEEYKKRFYEMEEWLSCKKELFDRQLQFPAMKNH